MVNPGTLATILGAGGAADSAGVKKVMDAIKMMSEAKLAQFNAQDVPTQVQDLIRCGYINSSDYLSKFTPATLDANQDALLKGLYPQLGSDAGQNTSGTIAKLVLDGYAGAGCGVFRRLRLSRPVKAGDGRQGSGGWRDDRPGFGARSTQENTVDDLCLHRWRRLSSGRSMVRR